MKAAVLHKPNSPLTIETRDDPQPGKREILLKVKASAVCHTDLHIAQGDWPLPRLPLVPGHEAVGVVEEVGSGGSGADAGIRSPAPLRNTRAPSRKIESADRRGHSQRHPHPDLRGRHTAGFAGRAGSGCSRNNQIHRRTLQARGDQRGIRPVA